MKLCTDCQHYQPSSGARNETEMQMFARCKRKREYKADYVLGLHTIVGITYCQAERNASFIDDVFGQRCGKSGRHWKPK
jgi:hypothetical protein